MSHDLKCDGVGTTPVQERLGAAGASPVPVKGERLEERRNEDRAWREERGAEFQSRLAQANALAASGMRLGTIALPAFGFSLVTGVLCGPVSLALVAVPSVFLLLLLPIASGMLCVGRVRRRLLLKYAQQNAIEVNHPEDWG